MALQKTEVTPQGFLAEDAYYRVEALKLVSKTEISFQLRAYKDAGAKLAFSDIAFNCEYSVEGKNPLEQAYEHLKTLVEFMECKDC